MKRRIAFIIVTSMALLLAGCGRASYPDLTDGAVAFKMGTFVDEADDSASYGTIELEGRTYIPYGTQGRTIARRDIDQCIGYIVMDENSASFTDLNDRSVRVYTLTGDTVHTYLMEYDTGTGLMNQPSFWRAADTKGLDIPTPEYIQSLGYSFWN